MSDLFQLSEFVFQLKNLNRKQSPVRLLPFSVTGKTPDYVYEFLYEDYIAPQEDEIILYTDERYLVVTENEAGSKTLYQTSRDGVPFSRWKELDSNQFQITLLSSSLREELHYYMIPDLLHLEIPLLRQNAFVLHSSFVEVNGKAILFTAKSGGGKSTQADLWMTYKKARIINGDKNIVAWKNGRWMAYGSPMSGSSQYCRNEGWPLGAVVVLEKGLENKPTLIGTEGFFPLFKQIITDPWDEEFNISLIDLVCKLSEDVPIYHYLCTKTQETVEVLEREFRKDGVYQ